MAIICSSFRKIEFALRIFELGPDQQVKLKQSNVISLAHIHEHDMHIKIHIDYTKRHNNGKSTATRSENLTKASIACWFMSNTQSFALNCQGNNAGNSKKILRREPNNKEQSSFTKLSANTSKMQTSRDEAEKSLDSLAVAKGNHKSFPCRVCCRYAAKWSRRDKKLIKTHQPIESYWRRKHKNSKQTRPNAHNRRSKQSCIERGE